MRHRVLLLGNDRLYNALPCVTERCLSADRSREEDKQRIQEIWMVLCLLQNKWPSIVS